MRFQDLGKRGVLQNIDPNLITEEPGWNVRQEGPELSDHIRALADSIKEVGVLEPLTVHVEGDRVVLTNGHCRLAAIRLLAEEGIEIRTVPVRTEPLLANAADRVLSLLTRNSGRPLRPLERAEVFRRLAAYGWKAQEIAGKASFTSSYVCQLLKLASAPPQVKQAIAAGEVASSTAIHALQAHGPEGAATVLAAGIEKAKAMGSARARPRHVRAAETPHPAVVNAWFDAYAKVERWDEAQRAIFGPHMVAAYEAGRAGVA
jgi:ParB-like chromosome segregation protein Spo0J